MKRVRFYFEPDGRLTSRWIGLYPGPSPFLWLLGAHRHGDINMNRDKQRACTSNPHWIPSLQKLFRAASLDRTDCVQAFDVVKGERLFGNGSFESKHPSPSPKNHGREKLLQNMSPLCGLPL